ncbi:MAG: chromophore lyase CpcT/CpeT [Bacteroidota bacterium]|jgi:CpeT protein
MIAAQRLAVPVFIILLVCGFDALAARGPGNDVDIDTLAMWLTGSFSSQKHSEIDSAYHNVVLNMQPFWKQRTDGVWIIVEQAMAATPDAPYRQRVYRVLRVEENMIEIEIYTWKDPKRVVGAWRDVTGLDDLSPSDLVRRRGCEVYLQRDEVKFLGSTHGTACSSDIRGASYATSEVQISANVISSWDRGFTSAGEQVWGAVKGPYYFLRQKP